MALRDTTAAQVHLWNVEDGQITDRTQTEAPPGAPLAIGDLNGDRHDGLAFYGETGEAGPFIGNFKSFPSVRPVIGTTILEPGAPIKGHIGNVTRPLGFPKSFLTPAEQTTPWYTSNTPVVWFYRGTWPAPYSAIYRSFIVDGKASGWSEIARLEAGVEAMALVRFGGDKVPGIVGQIGSEVRIIELENTSYPFTVAKSTTLRRNLAPAQPNGGDGGRVIGTARVNDDDLDDLLVYDPATRSVEAWLLTSDGDVSVQPVLADLPTNLEPEGVLRGPEQAELHVDQPIQLRPGVRVLDTDPGFVSASQEGTQITVRYSQTPQLAAPGTMMVGSVEDHAFFGRVMNGFTAAEMPSLGPNDVVYSIESTDLADLILNGSFRYVGAPVAPEVEGSVQTVAQSSQKPPAPNWLDDLGVTCTGESGLRFDITEKSLPPLVSPVFELNMSGGQVQGGKVGLQFGGQAKLQVEASASAAATCVLEPDLKLLRVLRFSHPLPIPIPGVAQAIRVTHSLTPTVRFEAGVSAQLFKVTASVTATLEFQAGFEYKSGAWQGYSAFTAKAEPKFEMPLAQQLALNLSFKLVPYINWTMGIWGLGDRYLPQTTLQYELATQLSAAASGCWEGKVEHKLDLGVAWRLPYFNPLIAGCDPNAAHVPDSPVWNGASSPQLPDCRCSQWVHKEFDLFWASEYPAWQLASNDGRDPSRHRAAALDWYLNGRCVDAEVSLGRFPEFTQVGVPYLNVQTPPGTDGGDWSALVNKAWLAGNMNRGGRIYLATSPRSKRAYYKSPPGKPDEFTAARTVTYDEFDQLRRNGYALEELSNRDACLATVADQNANGQPQPLPPANAKCGVATRNVFFDKALGVAQFKKNLFEATLWRGSGSFLGAQVCASCQLSAPKPTVLCAEENAPSLRL